MHRSIATFALCMIPFGSLAAAEKPAALAIPPDSPRWELEGQAKVDRASRAEGNLPRRGRGGGEGARDA